MMLQNTKISNTSDVFIQGIIQRWWFIGSVTFRYAIEHFGFLYLAKSFLSFNGV